MHWLAHQVEAVAALAPDGADPDRRRRFLTAITDLVDQVARRDGLDAVFASYDGLLVAAAGALAAETAEPMAALAQSTMDPIHVGLLGPVRQLVLIGAERKLALIRVGPVTLGLISPTAVSLAERTA